jgi:hypothetical protein
MRQEILGVALLVITPSIAFAQSGHMLVGGGVSVTAPASTFGDVADSSTGFEGFGSWPIRGMWSFRADAGFDRFSLTQNASTDCVAHGFECHDRVGHADAGVEISARRSSVRPYGFAEIGIYNFKQEGVVGSFQATSSSTNWGGAFGGGARAALGTDWGVGGALSTRWWRQGAASATQSYWFLEPAVFAYYQFGR